MNKEKTVKLSLILPEDLWRKISILALDKRISKNQLIIQILEEKLKEKQKP